MTDASTIQIVAISPNGGTTLDITTDCVFAEWRFTSQMAATPGEFQGVVRDPEQVYDFVTGWEIRCIIDGVTLWGGYILAAVRQFAVPVDDTVTRAPSAIKTRQWALRGSDYNYRLDRLVFRNTADYTHVVTLSGPIYDSEIIATYGAYFDVPDGWDLSTYVVPNFQFPASYTFGAGGNGQGFTMRDALADLTQYGAVAYVGPDRALRFLPVQDALAPWGFTDYAPDGEDFIGFREGSATEDLTPVANDAFVWGGSVWTNDGAVVAARRENADSIAAHGRWQTAEVRVGDTRYQSQDEVDARANVIVDGNVEGTTTEGQQGLALPETQYRLTWFAHRVPRSGGVPQHLYPGMVTTINLWSFSEDGGATPFTLTVPLRSVEITFPSLPPDGTPGDPLTWVKFTGMFGVLATDPEWLWAYLRKNLGQFQQNVNQGGRFSTAGSGTTDPVPYGTLWNGPTAEDPDGSRTTFTIPYGYIATTTQVMLNGLLATLDVDYEESDPAAGEITWIEADRSPLLTGDKLWIVARLTG